MDLASGAGEVKGRERGSDEESASWSGDPHLSSTLLTWPSLPCLHQPPGGPAHSQLGGKIGQVGRRQGQADMGDSPSQTQREICFSLQHPCPITVCVCMCVCVCWHHTQPAHLLLMPFSSQQYQKSGSFSPGSEILQVCSRPHSPPPTHSPFLLIRGGWSQSPALLPGDPTSRGRRPVLSPLTRATCPTSS